MERLVSWFERIVANNTASSQWVVRDAKGRPLHGLVQALRLGEYQRIIQVD